MSETRFNKIHLDPESVLSPGEDILHEVAKEAAKHYDDECVKLFCLKALEALREEGIYVKLWTCTDTEYNGPDEYGITWGIHFKGLDTSKHDKMVIERYKNGMDSTM